MKNYKIESLKEFSGYHYENLEKSGGLVIYEFSDYELAKRMRIFLLNSESCALYNTDLEFDKKYRNTFFIRVLYKFA